MGFIRAMAAAALAASSVIGIQSGSVPGGDKTVRRKAVSVSNARYRTRAWREYAAKVLSTHSVLPDGRRQDDPRDDKYLHSHARAMRALRRSIASGGNA